MRSIHLLPVALVALACAKEPAPAGAPAEAAPRPAHVQHVTDDLVGFLARLP